MGKGSPIRIDIRILEIKYKPIIHQTEMKRDWGGGYPYKVHHLYNYRLLCYYKTALFLEVKLVKLLTVLVWIHPSCFRHREESFITAETFITFIVHLENYIYMYIYTVYILYLYT